MARLTVLNDMDHCLSLSLTQLVNLLLWFQISISRNVWPALYIRWAPGRKPFCEPVYTMINLWWTSHNYALHIIILLRAFLESQVGVYPGLIPIKVCFPSALNCCIFIRYFECQATMSAHSMNTSHLFMHLFHTNPISLRACLKMCHFISSQFSPSKLDGGYDFSLRTEFLCSVPYNSSVEIIY